ncbi:DUF58 domain-containing protein [Roseomonas sp. JC162]|uniref:DUF58 domain-containing protein n=1 Tax=Neoroseomonas marina TaxID=1232220 RepID=A0A848E995_9PROT|nr:DUF58 domain-containing protein [Neoroseomonas marina]NMJ41031.1 DUF58 domain-containing protein [Neoroseomonas marina]
MDPRIVPTLESLIGLQHEARGFSFLHGQPVTSLLAGRRASRIRGRGLSFEEIRGYRPGDDIRLIDWRASARTGRTQTRVYTEERDRPALLVVNLTTATFFGTKHATKTAIIAQSAALAAWRSLQSGDRVGAVLFGDDGIEEHRPHRSRAAVMRILGAMSARAERLAAAPSRPALPGALNAALRAAEAMVTHDWLVLVVGDAQAADETSREILGRMARHNDVVGIVVSDPLERALPAAPWRGVATDGARVGVLDPARDGLGEKVPRSHAERIAWLRDSGLSLQIPVLPIGTEEPAAPQLRRMLGAAASPRQVRR